MIQVAKLLIDNKLITKTQYEYAYLEFMNREGTIGFHLIEQGAISSDMLVDFLSEHYQIIRKYRIHLDNISETTIKEVSPYICNQHRVIPIATQNNTLLLGITDPSFELGLQEARRVNAMSIIPVLVSEDDMTYALNKYHPTEDLTAGGTMVTGNAVPFGLYGQKPNAWTPASAADMELSEGVSIEGTSIEDALAQALHSASHGEADVSVKSPKKSSATPTLTLTLTPAKTQTLPDNKLKLPKSENAQSKSDKSKSTRLFGRHRA